MTDADQEPTAVPLDRLVQVLDLDQIDRDIFRAPNPGEGGGRVFGGQVASQALRAAAATVEADHGVHSLHAYFLRPGRYGTPITCVVDRIRDGKSFTTRRVVALQQGEAILNLDASFHKEEPGYEYALASPATAIDPPESFEPEPWLHRGHNHRPLDTRLIEPPPSPNSTRAVWVRVDGRLPDDPVLHACVITYISDHGPTGAVRARLADRDAFMMSASLDHCLWFHHPVRADEWLLYQLEAVAAAGARGVARGAIWTRDGRLAVSVAQEVLVRPIADA